MSKEYTKSQLALLSQLNDIEIAALNFEEITPEMMGIRDYIFKSIRKDGKYYTLDGKIEIRDPLYKKFAEFKALSIEEKRYLKANEQD